MTEIFEIENLKDLLHDVSRELRYEAGTRPGEGPVVEKLLLDAAKNTEKVIKELKSIINVMKAKGPE